MAATRRPEHRRRFLACLLCGLILAGCDRSPPLAPVEEPVLPANRLIVTARFTRPLATFVGLRDGLSSWTWRTSSTTPPDHGPAELAISDEVCTWTLLPAVTGMSGTIGSPPDSAASLLLAPDDTASWHIMRASWTDRVAQPWLPLRRQSVESTIYADLLPLLQELTTPRFDRIVVHWPDRPLPVRAPVAVSGDLDLTECLREAMDIWNEGQGETLLRWDPQAAWGVRFVHLAGAILSPTFYAQATRLDDLGHPLVVQIRAGDNYRDRRYRRYVVRALAHELGHCLCLWGHTRDRMHLLWGAAPPIVSGPSNDERRALALWRLLPPGLDLSRYQR